MGKSIAVEGSWLSYAQQLFDVSAVAQTGAVTTWVTTWPRYVHTPKLTEKPISWAWKCLEYCHFRARKWLRQGLPHEGHMIQWGPEV